MLASLGYPKLTSVVTLLLMNVFGTVWGAAGKNYSILILVYLSLFMHKQVLQFGSVLETWDYQIKISLKYPTKPEQLLYLEHTSSYQH